MSGLIDLDAAAAEAEGRRARAEWADITVPGRTARWLRDNIPAEPHWIIPGLLAEGWALMVSAREKTGKGTLISYLLGRIEKGEDTVFGLGADRKYTAMVYTEEPEDSIREKVDDADAEQTRYVFSWDMPKEVKALPYKDGARWKAMVDVLVRSAKEHGCDILFVDNISRASGVEEESGTELSRRIEYAAERCKDEGLTLIVDHHHRKSGGDMRDRSRGGTGSVGAVDVALAMDRGEDENDRRRALSCVGRRKACVWACTIKLNEDGTEYEMLEKAEPAERPNRGAAATEARRLESLAVACQERYRATGAEWLTADEIAGRWGMTLSGTKDYLRDRIPNGRVLAGPKRGRSSTYAAPGWQEVDDALLAAATSPDAPSF